MPVIDLLRPTVRAIRWGGPIAVAIPAIYLAWHMQNQPFLDASAAGVTVRVIAIMLTAGLAFSLDDPTEDSTGSTPVSILQRRALRIALVMPLTLGMWLVLRMWVAGGITERGQDLPTSSMIVEFLAFAAVGYAGAALGTRVLSDRLGGLAGAGSVLVVAVVLAVLPWGSGVLGRVPGSPEADSVAIWWQAIFVAGLLIWWRLSLPPGLAAWPRRRTRPRLAPVAVDRHRG
jgi:hypothetical protein